MAKNEINKQTSSTDYLEREGHRLLIIRRESGLSFRIIDPKTCRSEEETSFRNRELKEMIRMARESGETSIRLSIRAPSHRRGGIVITFPCAFLKKHMERSSLN